MVYILEESEKSKYKHYRPAFHKMGLGSDSYDARQLLQGF